MQHAATITRNRLGLTPRDYAREREVLSRRKHARHTKVAKLNIPIFSQQEIVGFNISMDHVQGNLHVRQPVNNAFIT